MTAGVQKDTIMEGSDNRYLDVGLIIRQKEPKNLEAPFDRIDSYLTPTELFYIRSHFPIPNLDRASYQLRIDGAVRHPFTLSYDELRNIRSETRVATLECAGNGRSFSSRRCKEHSGSSEQSALRNGPACPCARCWSVPS
jgi:DMSO/TMAO reductase YedYZ molybdopterin-dependent catalytic subunit